MTTPSVLLQYTQNVKSKTFGQDEKYQSQTK